MVDLSTGITVTPLKIDPIDAPLEPTSSAAILHKPDGAGDQSAQNTHDEDL